MFVNFNWYHLLIGNKKIREFEKKYITFLH